MIVRITRNLGKYDMKAAFAVGDTLNHGYCQRVDDIQRPSKEHAIAYGMIGVAKRAPKDQPPYIRTNSKHIISRLTNDKRRLEAEGWLSCGRDTDVFRTAAACLCARTAATCFEFDDGENNHRNIEKLIQFARAEMDRQDPHRPEPPTLPKEFSLPGMQLSSATQQSMTKAIRHTKAAKNRTPTHNRGQPRGSAARNQGSNWSRGQRPHPVEIQRTTRTSRNKPNRSCGEPCIGPTAVGRSLSAWAVDWEIVGKCRKCQGTESLEHILLGCQHPERQIIWTHAQVLCYRAGIQWPRLCMGTILGCGMTTWQDEAGKTHVGHTCLWRIGVLESAQLIWHLRCKRILDNDDPNYTHPTPFIIPEFYRILEDRLSTDQLLTNRRIYKKHALQHGLVVSTWYGLTTNPTGSDWFKNPRVLVGRHGFGCM